MRVGLTGGIGSGKSTVSALLADRGAVVIDYDLLAREAVEVGTPALARIVERFGPGVLRPDGALDRPALGAIVFGDDEARRDLEAITHPAIGELAWARDEAAPAGSIVVHDHPLLVETGLAGLMDFVVVVDLPEETQLDRLVRLRGMSPEDARARIAAQASRDDRRAAADVVIDNSGTPAELAAAVDALWARLRGQIGVGDTP
ncbi:MAG TPA: dephospho-CoA kinase [Aeromicrobium sp.]|nr:dephospho-CoA kinase [Aeromicrobium sp.]HKY57738.1 dephospho-CoA kinase [Aeromicrobium sp.]